MPRSDAQSAALPLGEERGSVGSLLLAVPQLGASGSGGGGQCWTELRFLRDHAPHVVILLLFQMISGDTCLRNPLHKQQSLPLRPIIPLVARISDQNASGAPPMTVREKTRLEKFRQLLSSHNTDLGESLEPQAR